MKSCSKVLVTGGAGFIGSHVVDRLLSDGYDVMVLGDLSSGSLDNVAHHEGEKGFHFVKGDIRERARGELFQKILIAFDVFQ